jgi:hypothetical protein
MSSNDGIHYSGTFSAREEGDVEEGHVSAALYSTGEQQLLFGGWVEGGISFWWWLQLEPVDSFE